MSTTDTRRVWAQSALDSYTAQRGSEGVTETDVQDLIVDLLHLIARDPSGDELMAEEVFRRAKSTYLAECEENWVVRVWGADDAAPLASWIIENRPEHEASREAAADIERTYGSVDWTLTRAS